MKKQKVRPMVDKDLRDEVVFYCGSKSFNWSLRNYILLHKRSIERGNSLTHENKALKKANAELSTTLEGTKKAYDSIFELYMDKTGSRLTYLRWGIVFGLIAGLGIGYLFP